MEGRIELRVEGRGSPVYLNVCTINPSNDLPGAFQIRELPNLLSEVNQAESIQEVRISYCHHHDRWRIQGSRIVPSCPVHDLMINYLWGWRLDSGSRQNIGGG
jgi:hypothetical protein